MIREWLDAWMSGGEPLEPPSGTAFAVFSAGLLLFAMFVSSVEFVPLLDHANLAFHEAGHLLFRIFGDTASLYGGTLMQFVFPAVTTVHFLHRGQVLSAAACAVWFCENLRYMARYMADARAQELPLVGGGEHDWLNIFARWNALESDTSIAAFFTGLCWAGMLAVWVLAWRAWRRGQE